MASTLAEPVTMKTATDLSAAANRNKFVKLSADRTVVLCTAAGEKAYGILETASPNLTCTVWPLSQGGRAKVELSATIAAGVEVSTTAGAIAKAAVTTERVTGQLVVGGNNGDVVEIDVYQGRVVP
jgi:hypothetical protein